MSKVVENKILDKENDLESNFGEEKNNIEYTQLSMDELIEKMHLLCKKEESKLSKDIEEIKSVFYNKLNIKKKEVNEENEIINKLDHLEIRFKEIYNIYRKIKADIRKKRKGEEEKNLKIKKQIIKDIDSLSKEEESIKSTFEKFRELQEKWKATGFVPITEKNHLWQTYYHHVELFYDYIKINKDLRDLDFKRNLEKKIKICEKAENLLKKKSVNHAHNKLQELHEHWKNIGPVEIKQREPLWQKFQEISRKINKKRNDHFIEIKKKNFLKLESKNLICKEINKLSSLKIKSHKEWQEATNNCQGLELKWKSLGGLDKEHNKLAWKEFRNSLSNFYNTRNDFYNNKKEKAKQVLKNKLSICERAEKLQNSTNWQKSGKELIKLQEDWKNTGFSPAIQSNKIWKRFKTACDIFFQSRKKHFQELEKEEITSFKEKEALVNKLKKFKIQSNSKENIERLKMFSSEWKKIGPIAKAKSNINDVFFTLINSKFSEIGLSKKELENEQYKNKVELIKGDNKAISIEQKIINNKIENLKKEISQYENNISYFGMGKATEPLLKQAKNKINSAKSIIKDLEQKIKLLKKV